MMTVPAYSQLQEARRFHAGLHLGLGLPKIPVSQWRSPISVTGGINSSIRFSHRWAAQISGDGLYTINLGSIDSREGELRFDLFWVSCDLLILMRGGTKNEAFFTVGGGAFSLSQRFDREYTRTNTGGISLGLVNWTHHNRFSSVLEVKWILLFKPNPNPQIASITFGVML